MTEDDLSEPAPDYVPAELLTDEDIVRLRHLRFGRLPARVLPSEMVELTETDPKRDAPETADRNDWIRYA